MKFNKFILAIGIISIAFTGCKTTNTATTTSVAAKMITSEGAVAKGASLTDEQVLSWPHMDIQKDGVPGMSTDRAHEFVKNKKATVVIVGIIDSGVDIEHEDLKDVLWTNPKEIVGNGKDDDNNGYVDDIHGWNFLGGEKISTPEQLEITRLMVKLKPIYDGKTIDQVTDKKEFEFYQKLKADFTTKYQEAAGQKAFYTGLHTTISKANDFLVKKLGKDTFTMEEVSKFAEEPAVKGAMMYLPRMLSGKRTLNEVLEQIQGGIDHFASSADIMYNVDFKGRVTGDNPDNWNDKHGYGNNFVHGGGAKELHGTHVAGIVGASRNNGIGMNGVADYVEIMTARAVPDGDEYDKDVAKAIRYVVDNGAKVVNMSFGKAYSPHSEWVYDAFKYAEKHDVLLVKAAGNNAEDIDLPSYLHFPTDSPENGETEICDNILTVGAITRNFDDKLVSTFSNYGKTRVDVFAPGSEIYSTVPLHDQYKSIQGTSMASPAVAGVAAMVRSYYPKLTAKQVKYIIINSGIDFNGDVIVPGTNGEKKNFKELSVGGKILNAYNALVMADKMSK